MIRKCQGENKINNTRSAASNGLQSPVWNKKFNFAMRVRVYV